MEYLSNGIIELAIEPIGAELQSIRRVASPAEYLWNGDPVFWDRRSPVLFPIAGRVWNNTAHIEGKDYELQQHGFARDMVFQKIIDEDRHMAFATRATEETKKLFPFDFELRIDYTLLRNVLTVGWMVTNHDQRTIPFQIGAHPGFLYRHYNADDEIHGFFSFDADSPLLSVPVGGGFAHPETFEVPVSSDGMLPLTNNTFECDTILETTGRLHRITLHDKDGHPLVTIRHKMPVTALWSPCGGRAPFVCIEPWHGCCDMEGYDGEFAQRHFMESVEPGQTWQTSYEIIIE